MKRSSRLPLASLVVASAGLASLALGEDAGSAGLSISDRAFRASHIYAAALTYFAHCSSASCDP